MEAAFVFYIFACEKVAKVMIGLQRGKPGPSPKFKDNKPRTSDIIKACHYLECSDILSDADIKAIFADDKFSAYSIRGRLFHDFGPTHLHYARREAPHLIKIMTKFLNCRGCVEAFLSSGG